MKIFISSTFIDLRNERQAVIEALVGTRISPGAMEFFPSEPTDPIDVALRSLEESDAVILLIGFKGGSLIPGAKDLTYTAAEFGRSMERKKPIFVFIKTEGGSWRNDEPNEPLKTLLTQFKNRVTGSAVTPAYFETPDQLKLNVVQALVNWNALGRPGARKTFATLSEYFLEPKANALFDYEQTFLGRSKQLEAFDSFLKSDEQLILIVTGRGGIGKSKFIKHSATEMTNRAVLFLRDGGIWHDESDREIPEGPILLIIDDAHHSPALVPLLANAKVLSEKRTIKLILTARPSGTSRLDAAIARTFDPSQIVNITLEALTHSDVKSLAEESLGPAYADYIPALVNLSSDTPLVTVVGGRLIARGQIPPQLLANEDDFRRAVFDKFVEEYEKNLPQSPIAWSSILPLIAALAPIRPRQEPFKELAKEFLAHREDQLLQAIDVLERHGLLLRGGYLMRIVPDVLADYLLERACINSKGEPTGYATAVFNHFGAAFLTNVLANLAELDWRIAHKHPAASLLVDAWKGLSQDFQQGDASVRVHLLKALHEAAVFQPDKTVELIRYAMEHEAVSVKQLGFVTSQQDVLNELPSLIQQVAYHLPYLDEMVRMLFRLARQDTRRPNQYPDHAIRIIKSLASYQRHKPATFNERMLEIAESLMQEPTAFDAKFTPLEIIRELLAKEGDYSESEGYTVTLGSFALNYSVLRSVRAKAANLVEHCLRSDNPKATRSALSVIEDVLHDSLPTFRHARSDDEIAWQDSERLEALEMLRRRIRQPAPLPLQREILRTLRYTRLGIGRALIREKVSEILAEMAQTDELIVFDALCSQSWDRDYEHGTDIDAATKAHATRVQAAARLFQQLYPDIKVQLEKLREYLRLAREFGIDARSSSNAVLNVLCENEAFWDELSQFLLANTDPDIGYLMSCVLLVIRNNRPEKYESIAGKAAAHANPAIAGAAASLSTSGLKPETLAAQDARILGTLVKHPDIWVRRSSLFSIRGLGKNPEYTKPAIELLLQVDVGTDEKAADDIFHAFAPQGIPMSSLSEEDVSAFLDKLVPVSDLDEYWTQQFLSWAAEKYPQRIFEFIILRIQRDTLLRQTSEDRRNYRPVPYSDLHSTFAGVQRTPLYAGMLAAVRDRLLDNDVMERFWLQNLFCSIAVFNDTTLHCIDEWLHSTDVSKMKAAIDLLANGPATVAFAKPFFAVHAIDCAAEISSELADSALGTLTANCFKGVLNSNPGEPPPRLVSTKQKGDELKALFAYSPSATKLFDAISKHAAETIERFRISDEEFLFNN